MQTAVKHQYKLIKAYRLGQKCAVLQRLMDEQRIISNHDGTFRIFSQEAVNGTGELALAGDYIRIDSTGTPYPNTAAFVRHNLRHLFGPYFLQIPHPVSVWTAEEDMCPEIEFLINKKSLILNESDPEHYFTAPLWGSTLSAAKNAVLVLYAVERNTQGQLTNLEFNFVEREEFHKTYRIIR